MAADLLWNTLNGLCSVVSIQIPGWCLAREPSPTITSISPARRSWQWRIQGSWTAAVESSCRDCGVCPQEIALINKIIVIRGKNANWTFIGFSSCAEIDYFREMKKNFRMYSNDNKEEE